MELARVAGQRGDLGVPACRDVDDEARLERVELHVVEHRRRSVGLAWSATSEAGVETRRLDELVRAAVVRVTVARRRRQDQLRSQLSQLGDQVMEQ